MSSTHFRDWRRWKPHRVYLPDLDSRGQIRDYKKVHSILESLELTEERHYLMTTKEIRFVDPEDAAWFKIHY